jgi:hypothetical protein
MKPCLQSADLTQEDWSVWLHARHGFHEIPWLTLIDAYEAADRRDAALMYRAQLPGNRNATDLWLPSTLWAEVRGGRLSIGREWP